MPAETILTLVILGATLVGLIFELAAPEIVLMAATTLLMLGQVLTPEEAVAGFGSPTLLTIAALLIVAGGIRRTGILNYLADVMLGHGDRREPLLRLMLPVGFFSAFLNNTPIVAIFTPAVLDWCKRKDKAPSRMLMPLSFATILGGICTLIGTSTTLVVDGFMRAAGMPGLGMFEIAGVGAPIAAAGIVIIWLLAPRVLPDRRDPIRNLSEERREFLVEMLVDADSPLVGRPVAEAGLRNLPGLFLVNIERDGEFRGAPAPDERLRAHDRLVFAGVASTVVELRRFPGLSPAPEAHYDPTKAESRDRLFEAVVSESSPLVGTTIKDIGFRSRYDAAVIAVHRAGRRLPMKLGEVELRAGDTLMVEAEEGFEQTWGDSLDFALVSPVRSEPHPRPSKAPVALGILAAMVISVSFGWLPMLVAAMTAVGLMLVTRVLSPQEARRSLNLSILVTIGGALALGRALEASGAAALLAGYVVDVSQAFGPRGILLATVLLSLVLTELITNAAAAAVVFPIASAAALSAGLDPRPFAVAVAIGCSTSFLTPTGYQTNLMVYGPGGYRFTDFSRLGAPLAVVAVVLTVVVIPDLWPLRP